MKTEHVLRVAAQVRAMLRSELALEDSHLLLASWLVPPLPPRATRNDAKKALFMALYGGTPPDLPLCSLPQNAYEFDPGVLRALILRQSPRR